MEHRSEEFVSQFLPVPCERLHQAAIRARIAAELLPCEIGVSIQAGGGAIWRRRCWRILGLVQSKSKPLKGKRVEKRRPRCERMHCRTHVMQKARQRYLGRARTTADGGGRFANEHGTSCARQRDGS